MIKVRDFLLRLLRHTKQRIDWHAVSARHTVAHLIAKLSSRVFLGEGLAKNSKLENIVVNYTHIGLEAVNALKAWPPIARSLVHWFIPQVRRAREILEEARQLLEPEIIRRKKEKSDCLAQGRPPPKYNDTLHWADETARRPFDPVALQLGLSLAAVHTTADLRARYSQSLSFPRVGRADARGGYLSAAPARDEQELDHKNALD